MAAEDTRRIIRQQGKVVAPPARAHARIVRYHSDVTTLVRPDRRDEDSLEGLRARCGQLAALLDARVAEAETVKTELEAFRLRYRREVGLLHDQLDALDIAIAEAELGELSKKLDAGSGSASEPRSGPASEPPPRFTSDAIRRLFRDVAKTIHPDLARDEGARDRRHALMAEANRAYTLGDEQQLRWILQAWERSPEAVQGTGDEAMRLRLLRRIAQIEEQLDMLDSELAALKDAPLWKLKAMVDEAAVRGKDIVADMVRRLKRDIMVATNRLDAMRPPQ